MDGDFSTNGLMRRTGAGAYAVSTLPTGEIVGTTATQTLTAKTLTSPAISDMTLTGAVVEDIFALTGTTPALEPANGTIQTWTLTANSTPTDSLVAGKAS